MFWFACELNLVGAVYVLDWLGQWKKSNGFGVWEFGVTHRCLQSDEHQRKKILCQPLPETDRRIHLRQYENKDNRENRRHEHHAIECSDASLEVLERDNQTWMNR